MDNNQFSEREKDVIEHLLQGKSNKQIALELGISSRTVEFHLGNIYGKLGIGSRSEAILRLTESQLRESTGDVPGESTVEELDDSTENGLKPTLRRIPVKKLTYILAALSALLLIAVIVIYEPSPQKTAPNLGDPVAQSTGTNTTPTSQPIPTIPIQVSTETLPTTLEPDLVTPVVIPPHTVNGYTAAIESYYIDMSHVIFQVRLTGEDLNNSDEHITRRLGYLDIYDEHGNLVNSSGGMGPAVDPALVQFEFVPTILLKGDHFKGQFAFNLHAAGPDYEKIVAKFRFDFELPIYPEVRFYPKQVVKANGLEILLDSVTVTPTFTQVYLCFEPPSFAPWTIGRQTVLQIGEQEAYLHNASELFSSATGSYWGTRSEPYWVPPVKNGSCHKIGFQAGSTNPTYLTLTIPDLENLSPYLSNENPLAQLPTLYPGLSEKQAIHAYFEENGYTHKGPWKFTVELKP